MSSPPQDLSFAWWSWSRSSRSSTTSLSPDPSPSPVAPVALPDSLHQHPQQVQAQAQAQARVSVLTPGLGFGPVTGPAMDRNPSSSASSPPSVSASGSTTASNTAHGPPRIHVLPHGITHVDHHRPQPTASGSGSGSGVGLSVGAVEQLEEDEEEHDYESLPVGHGWAVNMAAGAMAGISEHAAIFPIDSIKTRMQVLPALTPAALSSAGSSASASLATPQALNTITQHLRSVSTTEGLRSLWRGVASVIMGAGPAHAAHFGMYEFIREISGGRSEGWWGVGGTAALAGASATITSDALMNPFDVIKQRMQMRHSPYRSVLHCAKSVYHAEGLHAFYVSYPTTLTMTVPFTAVQFSVYESLKSLINPEGGYSPITHVVAGGVAGGVAAAVTTPLDVAKTLLQTRGDSTDPRIRNARGMAEALRIITSRDGIRGLRRGMLPRVLTVAPSTAISWMSYEFFKVLIRQGGVLPETGQQV
ncbi:Fe(2+) transporter [Saitozyma podzolica]|uniref:Fe(2+) transporter n=1 Tax=Saitozyma podzolica TaxID=1890683 RepID=A0A427YRC9_9TREE|nr:Fe(2+) transporter [Saitozyma podzolica]